MWFLWVDYAVSGFFLEDLFPFHKSACSLFLDQKHRNETFFNPYSCSSGDIVVRFYEPLNDEVVWEDYGKFHPSDIHRQVRVLFLKFMRVKSPQPNLTPVIFHHSDLTPLRVDTNQLWHLSDLTFNKREIKICYCIDNLIDISSSSLYVVDSSPSDMTTSWTDSARVKFIFCT